MKSRHFSELSKRYADNSEKKGIKSSSIDDDIHVEKNTQGVETLIFDPYNPLNKLITVDEIQEILKIYGINAPIHNYQLYKRAFIHQSYIKRPALENKQNNIVIVPKPEDCLGLFTKSNLIKLS